MILAVVINHAVRGVYPMTTPGPPPGTPTPRMWNPALDLELVEHLGRVVADLRPSPEQRAAGRRPRRRERPRV